MIKGLATNLMVIGLKKYICLYNKNICHSKKNHKHQFIPTFKIFPQYIKIITATRRQDTNFKRKQNKVSKSFLLT